MKAMQVNKADHGPVLIPAELPKPQAGLGELLVRVHAAGVTPTELLWYPTTHTKSGTARTRAVPGHEFSGVITTIGKDVHDFEVGDEVYGMNDWFADGATAEFCITLPQLEFKAEAQDFFDLTHGHSPGWHSVSPVRHIGESVCPV